MSEQSPSPSSVSAATQELYTVLGGRSLTVTHMDGRTEKIKVHQLAIEQFADYIDFQSQEHKLVGLLCDRPDTWYRSLKHEDYINILKIGEELNFTRAEAWIDRRGDAMARLRKRMESVIAHTPTLPDSPGMRLLPSGNHSMSSAECLRPKSTTCSKGTTNR